jgi:hypothetical protein
MLTADAPEAADRVGAAVSAVEAQAAAPVAMIALGINLPGGRSAELRLPVPLTAPDVCQILVALTDVITGRIEQVAAEQAGDVQSRLAARGIVVAHG